MNLNNPIRLILVLALLWTMPSVRTADGQVPDDTDSIVRLLGKNSDTSRVDMLLRISEELISSNPRQAFGYAREALSMAEDLGDTYRSGLAGKTVAGVYTVTAVYDKALEHLLTALSRFESLHDSLNLARCYNDIGVVYRLSGDFINARNNLQQAIQINKELRNYPQIAITYMNMGLAYLSADSVEKGLSYFTVSLLIADSLNMEKEKIQLLNYIGSGFLRVGKNEDALKNYYKVLDLVTERPDDLIRSEAMVNIARGYYSMQNYPAALKYARNGYTLAKARHFNDIYRDAARVLSDIHAAQGNYKLAYDYITEFRVISDTLASNEKAEQLARIQTLYDLSLKEQENQLLRQENLQNRKQVRTRTLVIIIITLLVIVLAVVLYLLNRMNDRQLALNKKLAAQSSELEALNDLKDKFFSFVAHNLKNPFNTIMGFSELMQRSADAHDTVKTRQYSNLIYDLSTQVQKVLSNLLEWSRLQRRNFEVKPETVELSNLAKDVLEMNNKEAARKDINLSIAGQGSVYAVADRSMIAAVLQNLVSNAINHTPASGKITIECRELGQTAEVTVADTGTGIPPENLSRLFHFDFSQVKIGSSESNGAGLGLIICHEILAKNNGTITATSEPGKGSRFTFTLPLVSPEDAGAAASESAPELTPAEITDNLLASTAPVSEEAIAELRTVVMPLFEEVSRVLSIENLEVFSRSVTTTGEKFHLEQLAFYGRSLGTLTRAHQIDQIIRMLPRFREYLNSKLN
jgi:signal transduction histidine kinase